MAHLRLAPTEYHASRNEIVLAGPDTMVAHLASARLRLRVRQQGMGGIVITCRMRLDLQAQTAAVDRTGDDSPGRSPRKPRPKAAKLLAFFVAATAERDAIDGPACPVTAGGLEQQRCAARANRIRAFCAANGLACQAADQPGPWSDKQFLINGHLMSAHEIAARYMPDLFTARTQDELTAG